MEPNCWACEKPIPPHRVREQTFDRSRSVIRKTLPGFLGKMGYGICPHCRQRFYIFYNRHEDPWVQPDMIPAVEDAFPPKAGSPTELRKRAWMRHKEEAMRAFFSSPGPGRQKRKAPPRQREKGKSPFQILGVPRDASRQVIARAYRKLAKKCHPDRVAQMDQEIQELAHRKFLLLKAAYDTLMR
ncbi:MAG: J domain-containing protein [Planctomycetota bacterium]|nr:J domain-containing protein [Planctomycetota bacterium]